MTKNHYLFKAIIGFRETERKQWNNQNSEVISRIKTISFDPSHKVLPYVHILDLKEDGYIKAHIDSSRVSGFCLYLRFYKIIGITLFPILLKFCGDTVAVLSLLSDAVLRLVIDKHKELYVDCMIPRRSLYIMK